ncbi:hypothetical protein ACHAXR_007798 [Thalassiosira sp. AJA248-18]
MTFPSNDDREIVLGVDPACSAPPATPTLTGGQTPVETTPPPPATTTTSSGGTIERSTNSDGSLSVKITTTTPRQPNRYRRVKIEYFHIPANMPRLLMLLDAGKPPKNLYRTNMEQRVLPPGTGVATILSHKPPTTTAPPNTLHHQGTAVHGSIRGDTHAETADGGSTDFQQQDTMVHGSIRCERSKMYRLSCVIGASLMALVFVGIVVARPEGSSAIVSMCIIIAACVPILALFYCYQKVTDRVE